MNLAQIRSALTQDRNLIIEAPPGAGKTTRVPPALLDLTPGRIVVLEPRRIAARLAARRVAAELGEEVGRTVGYQVRFEDVSSPGTRIQFVTEGVLTRKLLSQPNLPGIGVVILDEFHERHIDGDLALALLKRLQATSRPELKIVVMSATLKTKPISDYLYGCNIIRSEGSLFELSVGYTPYSAAPLEQQVTVALETMLGKTPGDVLVFLPGAAEIRRSVRSCEPLARRHNLLLLPLHGDLAPAEQDRAVAPAATRKVIFSTNVAESSITIEGVTAVIDSGLARLASDSPWTGLPTLNVGRISKASATQRAGRAARTAPGHVTRLYTAEDFQRRNEHDPPEILRRELSQVCLDLRVLGIRNPLDLDWLDAPPKNAVTAAEALLDRLGATGTTALKMAQYPLHPRLAKLVLEGTEDACAAAAWLSSGARPPASDVVSLLDSEWDPRTKQHYEQIRRLVRPPRQTKRDLDALLVSILKAFPDRVGRKRGRGEANLASGGSALLTDPDHISEFFVAVDIEDRSENALPLIRLTSSIQPEWLLDLFPNRIRETRRVEWNRTAERVEAVSALLYDELILDETRGTASDPAMLAERALQAGLARFVPVEHLDELMARIEFASEHTSIPKPDVKAALAELCQGLRSFAELKAVSANLLPMLEARANAQILNAVAPARIRLPNGRQTRVHYEPGKPPWIESRLQDFFGMRETPRVANGKVPLVVHLLAPNRRPVQTTTDLAGFWERLYPQVRRELSRRYPKHAWPE